MQAAEQLGLRREQHVIALAHRAVAQRLPSGKFATNRCILSLAGLAYNVLRLIGQSALLGEDAPLRHPAKRRRLKTVIQELIYVSAKVVSHARSQILNFGRHCPAFAVFERLYAQ